MRIICLVLFIVTVIAKEIQQRKSHEESEATVSKGLIMPPLI